MDFAVVDGARYGVAARTRQTARHLPRGPRGAGSRERRDGARSARSPASAARSSLNGAKKLPRRVVVLHETALRDLGRRADVDEGREARRGAVARPRAARDDGGPGDDRARAPTRSAGSSTRRARRGRPRATRCRTCARSRRSSRSSCGTSTRSSPSTRTSTAFDPGRADARARDVRSSIAGSASELALTARDVTAQHGRRTTSTARRSSSSRSSTRSPTGGCAAAARASGGAAGTPTSAARTRRSTTCLVTLAKLTRRSRRTRAEAMYQNLVVRAGAPGAQRERAPRGLAGGRRGARSTRRCRARCAVVRELVSIGLQARTDAKIKVRQPLRTRDDRPQRRARRASSSRAPSTPSARSSTSSRSRFGTDDDRRAFGKTTSSRTSARSGSAGSASRRRS